MSRLVDPQQIEHVVGINRHQTLHYGRAISSEKIFYILHSGSCVNNNSDLRDCEFSMALDLGLDEPVEDTVLILDVVDDFLVGVPYE